MLGPKSVFVKKNFGSHKFWSKKFGIRNIFGPTNFGLRNLDMKLLEFEKYVVIVVILPVFYVLMFLSLEGVFCLV